MLAPCRRGRAIARRLKGELGIDSFQEEIALSFSEHFDLVLARLIRTYPLKSSTEMLLVGRIR